MEILLRLGIAAVIVAAGAALYVASTKLRLHLLNRRASGSRNSIGFDLRSGAPAILYFTTPDCVPCRTVQGPAIEELSAQYGERLQIIKVDASQRIDLANAWGVLTVPTTFIIDAHGQPRHVNNGVTPAPRLRQQLREFGGLIDPITEPLRVVALKNGEVIHVRRE